VRLQPCANMLASRTTVASTAELRTQPHVPSNQHRLCGRLHPNGGQVDFVGLFARMPMGRTSGEPNEIKKDTHPKNITALFTGRPVEVVLGDDGVDGLARQGKAREVPCLMGGSRPT